MTHSINYLITEGIVSKACKDYKSVTGINGFCSFTCDDPTVAYEKYACKHGSARVFTTHEEIMTEVMNNGPVQVGFIIYDDFMYYAGGIYETNDLSTQAGGHAVKLIGWDYDPNGRLYWICQNQWGTSWGLSGYFNIYAGQCGIDSVGSSCEPDIKVIS